LIFEVPPGLVFADCGEISFGVHCAKVAIDAEGAVRMRPLYQDNKFLISPIDCVEIVAVFANCRLLEGVEFAGVVKSVRVLMEKPPVEFDHGFVNGVFDSSLGLGCH
jgi:hypothetical protein